MPVQCAFAPSRRAIASVTAPVPQPTSSTLLPDDTASASASNVSSGANIRSIVSCTSTHARPDGPFHRADCASLGRLVSIVDSLLVRE